MKYLLSLLLTLSVTSAAAAGPSITVNGKAYSTSAQVIGGQTYIPLSVLDGLGIPYKMTGGKLVIGGPQAVAGGANERPSLAGCRNEWLFNGVWRVKVGQVVRIQKDADTPGWGVGIEVRNGSKVTILGIDAGWSSGGDGVQLAFPDATTLNADDMDIQKLTVSNSFPQGGVALHQLKFYAPFGTAAGSLKTPSKLLIQINPKGIGFTAGQNGVAFNTPTPSFRVDLTCTK